VSAPIKKILFIINKFSGKGFQSRLEGRIIDVCRDNDAECSLEFTRERGHATLLAQQGASENFDIITAVGGDGTINEVASGLLHTTTPLGIVPKGSGNGLARHLGIPLDVLKATRAIFHHKPILMDTFTVNGKLSVNVSGIGFDGHIANQFGKNGKRGLPGYTKLTLGEYSRFREFEVTISTDSHRSERKAFVIAIANSSQYGNNARIAPHASICDEKLNVSILHKIPPYRLDLIYAFFNGQIDQSAFCEVMEAGDCEIDLSEPMEYHVDGEPCGRDSHFNIRLLPSSLHILIPRQSNNNI
jgi:YegS/Rv2252/BmrU family lipid kinase